MQNISFDPDQTDRASGQARIPPVAIVLLVLVAALIGATLYLYLDLKATRAELTERLQAHEEQIAQLEGSVNRASRTVDTRVEEMKGLMATAEKQLSAKAQQVESRVLGRTRNLAKELEQQKSSQQAAFSDVSGKIQELRAATSEAGDALGSLTGRVDTVKTEVDQTRQELEETIRELRTVKGDLGVQSGLIATNATELSALKRLGERNYYEFDIRKTKQPQRVGSISIKLRKADRKRGKYTIDLWADDRRIEKKDKTLLEPVQFYVQGSRLPYEIVVNQLEKNRIAGYLATPKDEPRRAAAQSTGGQD